jgi:hypothetical protein
VSAGYIRLIPTDRNWQPAPEAAATVLVYLARLFSGPDDNVEEVSYEFYDQVTLIDAGENTTRITCSRCAGDIGVRWFFGLMEEHGESIQGGERRFSGASAALWCRLRSAAGSKHQDRSGVRYDR